MKLFIHRSGRTARAGKAGTAYCLLTKEEIPYMHDLSVFVGRKHSSEGDKIDDAQIVSSFS